jgi:hypothetical protein
MGESPMPDEALWYPVSRAIAVTEVATIFGVDGTGSPNSCGAM